MAAADNDDECARLRAELAERDAEIARLQDMATNAVANAVADQAALKGMTVEDGALVLELGPPRELVIAWVDAARKMLGDAENYSETRIDIPREAFSMEIKAAGEFDRYVFTVQRAGKLTPHEARQAAEADRDAAHAELAELNRQRDQWWEHVGREKAALRAEVAPLRELLHVIWLYVDWRYVTRQLTTEQKELWATAIEQTPWDEQVVDVDRWWQQPRTSAAPPPPSPTSQASPGGLASSDSDDNEREC